MGDNPNVGPDPVEAKPNTQREKTFEPANQPPELTAELQKLPEKTAEAKVETDMPKAVDQVRSKL